VGNQTTDYYDSASERGVIWDDPDLAIPWRLTGEAVLSAKDKPRVARSSAVNSPVNCALAPLGAGLPLSTVMCSEPQSSAGRARDHCNGFEVSGPQSLHVGT